MKKHLLPVLIFIQLILVFAFKLNAQADQMFWFDKAAEYFEESFVLGNGRMGATVYGGVEKEKIHLNDITLWSGEPVNPHMNPDAHQHIPSIRKALANENYQKADSLNKFLQGSFSQSYAPLGDLLINFKHQGKIKNYRRALDISQAISTLSYEVKGTLFEREYFVSHPDQLIVIKLKSSKKRALNASISFESLLKFESKSQGKEILINGYAPYHAEPNYRGDMPNAVRFDKNRGTRFTAIILAEIIDGQIIASDSQLQLIDCTEAEIRISLATSFNGFDKDPAKEGLDNQTLAFSHIATANNKSFDQIKKEHIEDYTSFYDRVNLKLSKSNHTDLPMDQRLLRYAEGEEDQDLETLYFNFGRYLLISSSRTPGVPANLQGLWNYLIRPPWSSNYTININAEENYWLAEIANLSELHHPLLSFIENVAETGKITAPTFYGVGGWCAGHNSDIWAMSNPVGDFGKGHPVWACWTMGGTWLAAHLWEHYLFNRDLDYLKSKAYPLMQGAVQFCIEWMIRDQNGKWITSPGTSPENIYLTPDGYKGATLYGATGDLAMIRELFLNFLSASETLGIESDFVKIVANTLKELHPYQIGSKGNLQEWYHDWEDSDPKHRHQTHLFGLHPGHHIFPGINDDLVEACRRSLEIKGDYTTGWSKGWRINLWARIWDGNRAYKMYRELLRYTDHTGGDIRYSGGGTYVNLLDAHPPFQIDGNFGGASGVIEMIMQSKEDYIYLLPALPDAWPEGEISGICARGGFEIDMKWENGQLIRSRIKSKSGGKTTVSYKNLKRDIELKKGESIEIHWNK